ncbi:MAG: hypothetical protein AAFY91_00385 [Bacteroidota bacterium]
MLESNSRRKRLGREPDIHAYLFCIESILLTILLIQFFLTDYTGFLPYSPWVSEDVPFYLVVISAAHQFFFSAILGWQSANRNYRRYVICASVYLFFLVFVFIFSLAILASGALIHLAAALVLLPPVFLSWWLTKIQFSGLKTEKRSASPDDDILDSDM